MREEQVDDLIFTREPEAPGTARARRRRAQDTAGASEAGLGLGPAPGTSAAGSRASRPPVARRSSINVKGTRRVSSLRDGAPAYPPAQVPDDTLYRHLSDQAPPVVRMKHLLGWTLHRSMAQALGEENVPRSKPRSHDDAGDSESLLAAPPERATRALSDKERQMFAEAAPLIRKVLDETLRDLNEGLIGISWLHQSHGKEDKALQPHPRNQSNAHAAQQLEGMLTQLDGELRAWHEQEDTVAQLERETEKIEAAAALVRERSARSGGRGRAGASEPEEEAALDEEVERVLRGGTSHPTGDGDGDEEDASVPEPLAWRYDELDEQTRQHLDYARTTLDAAEDLNAALTSNTERPGTELDARVPGLEFTVDSAHARLHPVVQLAELAKRFLTAVSGRAAQSLQERTSAGLATFSGAAAASRDTDEASEEAQHQRRLDALLAGIRDPHGAADGPEAAAAPADTKDLLRALAAKGP